MTFQIEITGRARREFSNRLRWLEARSKAGARAWYAKWKEALKRLEDFADGQGLAPEDEDHEDRIQETYSITRRGGRYRIVFMFRANIVYVLGVRDPGQDLMRPDEIELPEREYRTPQPGRINRDSTNGDHPMPITREELDSFHSFAVERISNVSTDVNWPELVESWRLEHPSAAERAEVNEIIRQGLEEIGAGGGRPAHEVMTRLRAKYGLPSE